MNKVTAFNSIFVDRSPEEVWDYTQNWKSRAEWDYSVNSADFISLNHPVTVKVYGKGGLSFLVKYKVSQRPRLTTLAMTEVKSFWIKGGGGSWKYENENGGTRWTQHNAFVLRDGFLGKVTQPLFAFALAFTTKQIMSKAKKKIEAL